MTTYARIIFMNEILQQKQKRISFIYYSTKLIKTKEFYYFSHHFITLPVIHSNTTHVHSLIPILPGHNVCLHFNKESKLNRKSVSECIKGVVFNIHTHICLLYAIKRMFTF